MEQKRTGLSYVFTLAKEERGKLSLGMLLAVFSSALSFVPYLVVYQILLLIIKQEVTLPAMLGWAGIGIAAAVLQAILTSFAGICSHTAAFNTMHRIKVRVLEHEHKIQLALQNLLRGKTTIMIAHRLHTIRNADNIVVFQDGKVAEQGTHDELIARGSTYSHMWDTYTRETIGEE